MLGDSKVALPILIVTDLQSTQYDGWQVYSGLIEGIGHL